jgi:hypothetical protein
MTFRASTESWSPKDGETQFWFDGDEMLVIVRRERGADRAESGSFSSYLQEIGRHLQRMRRNVRG